MTDVRVVVVAESFLPHVNGVTQSVLHVLAQLRRRGDQVTVIAPAASSPVPDESELCHGFSVLRLPSMPLPDYPAVRVAPGTTARVKNMLLRLQPDVVHVASPFVLGWRAIQAAQALGLPTVSIYQTEVPAYASRYRIPWAEQLLWQHVERMHHASTLTLVPSSFSMAQLQQRGIQRVKMWRRGVDLHRFHPARRSSRLREKIAPSGEVLIGYVGRLAAEKQLEDLAVLDALPGTRLVLIGSGPQEQALRRLLPRAYFAGHQNGTALGEHMASLDVFVHPGSSETFCQTIQEAYAAQVPVVAVGRGGPLDLVDPGRTGWLYAPGDLEGMRSAVQHLVDDDAARAAFAAAGLARVQQCSWEAVCNQLVGRYARAIEVNARVVGMRTQGHSRPRAVRESEISFPSGP